ncbi:MAG: hypothetical protein ACOY82_12675 [Pseudomonadota bacterium]
MNRFRNTGFAIALLGLAMTSSTEVRAEALPTLECNESTYGAFQRTSEVAPEGTYIYFYGCTEYGWMLFGTEFCDNEGNCYSD